MTTVLRQGMEPKFLVIFSSVYLNGDNLYVASLSRIRVVRSTQSPVYLFETDFVLVILFARVLPLNYVYDRILVGFLYI